ncbi:MAG: hypothetical protein V3V45_04860 [Candidatus Brocadiales bacterium]
MTIGTYGNKITVCVLDSRREVEVYYRNYVWWSDVLAMGLRGQGGFQYMIHYSCDMCSKVIQSEEELRYVVKIEIYPADVDDVEDENGEFDDIKDDLAEFNLEGEREPEEDSDEEDMEYKTLRFDLCSDCHKAYVRDPIFAKSYRSRFFDN